MRFRIFHSDTHVGNVPQAALEPLRRSFGALKFELALHDVREISKALSLCYGRNVLTCTVDSGLPSRFALPFAFAEQLNRLLYPFVPFVPFVLRYCS